MMSKILQSVVDMTMAKAVGTNPQQLASMRTYSDKMKDAEKNAKAEVKAAKQVGTKSDLKEAQQKLKDTKEVSRDLKVSKFLTMAGVASDSYTQTSVQNARSVLNGKHDEVVDQNALQAFGGTKKERELPAQAASLAAKIEKNMSSGMEF